MVVIVRKNIALFVFLALVVSGAVNAQDLPSPPSQVGDASDPIGSTIQVALLVGGLFIGLLVLLGAYNLFTGAFKKFNDVMNGRGEWKDVGGALGGGIAILVIGILVLTFAYQYFQQVTGS